MKTVAVALFGMALVLTGCGGTGGTRNSANPVSGFWSVTLNSSTVPPGASTTQFLNLTFALTQNGSTVSGTNLNINQTTTCFGAGTTISGQVTMGVAGQGNAIQLTLVSAGGAGAQNTLTLVGGLSSAMNGASGNFTLVGVTPGCVSTAGTFSMSQQLAPAH